MLVIADRIKQKAQSFRLSLFRRTSINFYWFFIRILKELLKLPHVKYDFLLFVKELGRKRFQFKLSLSGSFKHHSADGPKLLQLTLMAVDLFHFVLKGALFFGESGLPQRWACSFARFFS